MMLRSRFCVFCFGLAGIMLLLAGCDTSPAGVTVKVNVATQKLKLEETDSIQVSFEPDGAKVDAAAAGGSAKDLPLTATRATAPGVVPGKYKLMVKITPYAGMAPPDRVAAAEALSSQFDSTNSKLTYEVTADKEQSITIDLDAQTVTKN